MRSVVVADPAGGGEEIFVNANDLIDEAVSDRNSFCKCRRPAPRKSTASRNLHGVSVPALPACDGLVYGRNDQD